MDENKLCIACGNGILQSAKKCPHCHTWQSGLLPGPFKDQFMGTAILAVLVVLLVMIVTSRCSAPPNDKVSFSNQKDRITIIDSKLHLGSGGNGSFLSCIGTVNNDTAYAWQALVLEVRFLDAGGNLIDTLVSRDSVLAMPPRSSAAFRIRGRPDKPPGAYGSHEVIVRWATAVD